jgi:hypothetical protein
MRESTLLAHLSLTEEALRSERIRIANQLDLMRELKLDGRDLSSARELLQAMNDNLRSLERHRERLKRQLGLPGSPPPSPAHRGGHTRRD